MPYSSSPGRTASYQTRESRSNAGAVARVTEHSAIGIRAFGVRDSGFGDPIDTARRQRTRQRRSVHAACRTPDSRARLQTRNACRRRRVAGSGWPAVRAASAAGCRDGTRAGSCRCRSSGGRRSSVERRIAAACTARAAPGVEIVGVSEKSNRPSRSLTLSAPKTRIGTRTPACRARCPLRCPRTPASSLPPARSASATRGAP